MRTLVLILVLFSQFAFAQEQEDTSGVPQVEIDVPIVDYPFNFSEDEYTFPSMRQSLALSTDFYQAAHAAIGGYRENRNIWRRLGVAAFDVFTTWMPLSNSWLHEEWHRSVLSQRGYASYNDVYNFPMFSESIAVSHVSDADLAELKREHPAEQVRLSAAGMESQVYQNLRFDKTHFFEDAKTEDYLVQILNTVNVSSYLFTCASTEADSMTDDQNRDDGTNVKKRDFTGLDCDAWVYDLFRPDEPYAARGVHPSGVGIDRYIRYSDLTAHEQRFLKRQAFLSLLNFADPMMWHQNEFHGRMLHKDILWNASASHYLTSFGYTVDANLFVKTTDEKTKLLITLHNGFNAASYFPGLTAEWMDIELSDKISLTNAATLWSQPKNQRIGEHNNELLASLETEVSYKLAERTKIYLGVEGKTAGWEAGEEDIEKAWDVFAGFKQTVF